MAQTHSSTSYAIEACRIGSYTRGQFERSSAPIFGVSWVLCRSDEEGTHIGLFGLIDIVAREGLGMRRHWRPPRNGMEDGLVKERRDHHELEINTVRRAYSSGAPRRPCLCWTAPCEEQGS
jgi:hypothetical protein